MKFDAIFEKLMVYLTEDEGDELALSGDTEGDVGGVDLLDDPQSALSGDDVTPQVDTKLIELTNLLLDAIRFKPTREFSAYIKMPRFLNLSLFKKLTTIKNAIADHPERIYQEATEDVSEFGNEDESLNSLSEVEEADILRMIIRSININPYTLEHTLKKLPSSADENNYIEIINTVETALF